MNKELVRSLAQLLSGCQKAVFFGGAGVSTASGIPDFRGGQGLFSSVRQIPPETILSRSFFDRYPEAFYRYYRENLLHPFAQPNAAHTVLAKWEAQGRLGAVITQNIDGLHQQAGSKKVWELHGSVHRNTCMRCGRAFDLAHIVGTAGVPRCGCAGVIKPDVVLYEEALDESVMTGAAGSISTCDLLIVGGTSLRVYPAAGFVADYPGTLVIINKESTPMDGTADLVIEGAIDQVLAAADALL